MSELRKHWTLDPDVAFLNHGSFGACPREVLETASEWRARIEREPVHFYMTEIERLLDGVRERVGRFVGAAEEDLAFVPNATTGANAVLKALRLEPGDEIVRTNHGYNAVNNVIDRVASRAGARVVVAQIPFPIRHADEAVAALHAAVSANTKLVVIDHITSPTALVLPIERMVRELYALGIDALVDGAHAPGHVPLDLRTLNPAYYTGNFHKWCCAPKSAAFLYVRKDKQALIHPTVTSHGANSSRTDKSRFRLEFDWTGTTDPTAVLCVPKTLDVLERMVPGGFAEIMRRNRELALSARNHLHEALGLALPCPEEMVGAMAALILPDAPPQSRPSRYAYALQDALVSKHRVQAPIIAWPRAPHRLVRISAQLYNHFEEYEVLAQALKGELIAERSAS